jgi:hypothetical protein
LKVKIYVTVTLIVALFGGPSFGAISAVGSQNISIEAMGYHQIKKGQIFRFQPRIRGDVNLCRKDMGHDDVKVHPETGAITWDTSGLTFGRGFHIRIKCSSIERSSYASMVVHVDATGGSRLRILGKDGIASTIADASTDINSGDTLVIPDGIYPVSISHDGSYENAFKMSAPTNGSKMQFTTVIAESPGGAVVSGTANTKLGKQKNAIQLSESSYVAIVGLVARDVQRESVTTSGPGHHLLLDFVGAAGAGTWGKPCGNFKQAKKGQCSNAGMRVNGGTPLIQQSYDWGHNRYGIMTRSTNGSVTRRSLVRLDEHRGDQPYGGFSDYCDKAHLNQDNYVFDSLAIAAPHYKNYAGLAAAPATGCQKMKAEYQVVGLFSVNNHLSLSLMDSKAGSPNIWRNIVSYDTRGTCTPQKGRCGAWLLQSKKVATVTDSYFGKSRDFNGESVLKGPVSRKNINLEESVILNDVPGYTDRGKVPRYLPESQLYFNGRMDTFWGDSGFNDQTQVRRWPIPGEDIISRNMRAYHNPKALKVGGGTIEIDGNRGAAHDSDSMSEYFWGYTDSNIPPIVVRVSASLLKQMTNRVAWEDFAGKAKQRVKGWSIYCYSDQSEKLTLLKTVARNRLSYHDTTQCSAYAVTAIYDEGESGIAYIERVFKG